MNAERTAAIVRAGVAGPALAVALQQIGADAVVCEARRTGDSPEGSILAIASNGIDALRTLKADAPSSPSGSRPHRSPRS
jgi:FAD-dependent urate hydroxylase